MAKDVIVVGSGIAGLTAAYYLDKAGYSPTVLEATGRVGGRMTTDRFDGFIMDRGAQFLSDAYTTLMPLIGELGLEKDLRPTSPWAAIIKDSIPRRINGSNPFSVLGSGLLSFREFARLGWRSFLLAPSIRNLSLADYAQWTGLDDETADAWYRRYLGANITDYLIEPQLQGFYFQSPEDTSRAIAHMILGFALKKAKIVTLANGIGSLPEAIARTLTVRLNEPVEEVVQDGSEVVVTSTKSSYRAQWCVVATTATTAKSILRETDAHERGLVSTKYSSTVNLGIGVGSEFRIPPVLRDVYGLLIPRKERQCIAAVTLESNKDKGRTPGGELLDVMLSGEAGAEWIEQSDELIENAVLNELETCFPGIRQAKKFTRMVKWKDAEPMSPVGRSRLVADYKAGWSPERRIILAGDYLGFPFTDSAAHTGKWAAEKILECRP